VFHQHRRILQALPVPAAGFPLASADQPAVAETPSPPPTAQPAALLPPSAGASPRHSHRRLCYEAPG
jgi:hypothetical protein